MLWHSRILEFFFSIAQAKVNICTAFHFTCTKCIACYIHCGFCECVCLYQCAWHNPATCPASPGPPCWGLSRSGGIGETCPPLSAVKSVWALSFKWKKNCGRSEDGLMHRNWNQSSWITVRHKSGLQKIWFQHVYLHMLP